MFAVKFNVDVVHDVSTEDGDTSAYLVCKVIDTQCDRV